MLELIHNLTLKEGTYEAT